ncbi:MAG: hypothetical protein KAZ48_08335 [Candidatus Nanopelagicales bacterium]|nr:hypothetical protein [Candidatus Nanopelagicales bacterium]
MTRANVSSDSWGVTSVGTHVHVGNVGDNSLPVLDNSVGIVNTVPVGAEPYEVAVDPSITAG